MFENSIYGMAEVTNKLKIIFFYIKKSINIEKNFKTDS